MTFLRQRLFHGLRHLQLSAAKFVSRMGAREHAAWGEELIERNALGAGRS